MSDDNYKSDGEAWGYYMPTYNPPHYYGYTYISSNYVYTDEDGKSETFMYREDGMSGYVYGYLDNLYGKFYADNSNLHSSGWYSTVYEDNYEYKEYNSSSGK